MRISTSYMYQRSVNNINSRQAELTKKYDQASSGKRITAPADDPVASSRILEVEQNRKINDQYKVNTTKVSESLEMVDSEIGTMTELLINTKELVIQGSNGSMSDDNLKTIAKDLRGKFEQLLASGNRKNGSGEYLFSGFLGTTQPFQATVANLGKGLWQADGTLADASGTPVTDPATGSPMTVMANAATGGYSGDDGVRAIQISSSRDIPISETGKNLFTDVNGSGANIFKTLNDLIYTMESGKGSPNFQTNITSGLNNVDKTLKEMSNVRTSVGSRLRENDTMFNMSSSLDVEYEKVIQNLDGLDLTQAYSDLSMQDTFLQAARQSFQYVQKSTLFNFL